MHSNPSEFSATPWWLFCAIALLLTIGVAGWVLYWWVFARLRTRHHDAWQALGAPHLLVGNSISSSLKVLRWLWTRQYEVLNDVVLVNWAKVLRITLPIYTVVFLVALTMLIVLLRDGQ